MILKNKLNKSIKTNEKDKLKNYIKKIKYLVYEKDIENKRI